MYQRPNILSMIVLQNLHFMYPSGIKSKVKQNQKVISFQH